MKLLRHFSLWLLAASCPVSAQVDSLWSRTFGGASYEFCQSVQQTTDGGYILGGYRQMGGSDNNFWLVKTDTNGDSLWTRTFGGAANEACYAVQQTSDGGYILAGEGTSGGDQEFWVVKTNANGNQVWARFYRGANEDVCRSVQQTSDGGYILAGYTNSFGAGAWDFWLVKTNSNGDSLWSRTFGGTGYDECKAVQQTTDGGYMLAGWSESLAPSGEFWLIKTDANGDSMWSRHFGGSQADGCYSAQQTSDGGYILAGHTYSFGAGISDFWLIKTDANGDSLWSNSFGGSNYETNFAVQQTTDGGYIVAGVTSSFGGGEEFWLVKTNAVGDSLWSRKFGGSSYEICFSARQTADGGYILAGITYSFGAGAADFWLVKTIQVQPYITSITDVGNNQGRNVRVRWNRCRYDGGNPAYTITGYSIYRRIDEYLNNVIIPPQNPALEWPPGEWEFITTVPAYGEETYAAIVPTLADSSSTGIYWSVFFLRAATPNPLVYFDSEVDSGYSVDNLAPDPTLVVADLGIADGNLILRWEEISTGGGGQQEMNGIWYRVHGSTDPGFIANESNLLTTTQTLSYFRPLDQNRFYFMVLVSDDH